VTSLDARPRRPPRGVHRLHDPGLRPRPARSDLVQHPPRRGHRGDRAEQLLFSVFYILTALATMVYYWRRVVSGVRDFLTLGLLPLGAAVFLSWILVKSLIGAPAPQVWSFVGIACAGVILMFVARFSMRSPFFQIPRESDAGTARLQLEAGQLRQAGCRGRQRRVRARRVRRQCLATKGR